MQRFISIFGRVLTIDSKHYLCGVNSSVFLNNNNIRCFNTAVESPKVSDGAFTKKVHNISELVQHVNSGNLFYLKQLTNVLHTINFEKINSDEALHLLKCCGSVVADSSREQRNNVCQDIFNGLQNFNNINTEILNRYIKTCTENSILIYNKEPVLKYEPNIETYKLLLENVCHFGRIEDAFAILEIMKTKEIAVDNDSLNNLILAHTLRGGLKAATAVLDTVRTTQVSESKAAKLALFKGLIRQKNLQEFKEAVKQYPITFDDCELLDFIEELGLKGLDSWLNEVQAFYKHIPITRDLQIAIERICIHLIHMKQPSSAIKFYETFVEALVDVPFGYALLKEMLHCDIDITTIISIARGIVEKELNPYILESLTHLALKFKFEEQAWALLKSLQTVRPHYFWPLLVHSGKSYGENGIFSTLKRITEFDVKLDAEGLQQYVFPYCEISNLKLLILKLQEVGFTVREIISPLLIVLLKQKQTKEASELCRLHDVNISGDRFLQLLASSWASNKDSTSTLILLARYCESNPSGADLVGTFLILTAKRCKLKSDLQAYLTLIQTIAKTRLKISAPSADLIKQICSPYMDSDSQKQLDATIHSLLDFGLTMAEDVPIPHPKSLDLDGLESHLIELQEKNMETRGVLRKLLQMHASKGNVQRVKHLRQLFLDSGYKESPGMKSAIMHSYVIGKQLDEAMELYDEIRTFNPEFRLDSFKFIDLVRLLIDNDRFEEGYSILQDDVSKWKKTGNMKSIERNCKNLLSACKNAGHLEKMFSILLQSGICVISNIMLGPLVKIHLKNGEIDMAVKKYIELSKTHKCTPLQFEVLCAVAKGENSDQLEQVLRATEVVHGFGPTQVGLISALAENGQENALKKVLIQCNSPIRGLLQNRCKRWVEERKIGPLKCLANTCNRLPRKFVDVDFIYKCVFDIYDLSGDPEGAVAFFKSLPEDLKSLKLEEVLQKLCDKNKISMLNARVAKTL